MHQLYQESDAVRTRLRLRRLYEAALRRRAANVVRSIIGLVVNIVTPVAGALPLSAQTYLRDHVALFKDLDPRTVTSASAIYLLAFSLIGLGDIIGGTILAEGIGITYPFPRQ